MKKIILFSLLIARLFSACDKIEYDPKGKPLEFAENVKYNLMFNAAERSASIVFKANYAWNAESDADWLTIPSPYGNKSSHSTLNFNITKNESTEDRTGHITIHSGDIMVVFSITQKVSDFFFEDNTSFIVYLNNVAHDTNFVFYTNVDWTVTADASWLTTFTKSSSDTSILQITVSANDKSDRTGIITVSGGNSSFDIKVIQTVVGNNFNILSVIEDNDFKNYCKQFDSNKDGILSISEASLVKNINLNSVSTSLKNVKGIEYFKNLTTFSADRKYNITDLDFSTNSELAELNVTNCSDLQNLTISKNTKLKKLICAGTQFTSLDVTANTALEELNCNNCRKLESINANNTNLKKIETFYEVPALQTIDVSNTNLTQLTFLNQSSADNLQSINVSGCKDLASITISRGQISSLNLTGCTALQRLSINKTKGISSLNLGEQTALTTLLVQTGELSSVDISKNTELDSLAIGENNLTALNINNNTKLTYLRITDNALTTLDVTKHTKLTSLTLYKTSISALNVSNNTELTYLYAAYNQLTELEVSKNTKLEGLYVSDNKISSLDVSNNLKLQILSCVQLTDESGKNYLKTLYLKSGQSIPNITTNKNNEYISDDTKIEYK